MDLKFIRRIFLLPFGMVRFFIEGINEKARDIDNRRRFKHAIIDDGCSFTNNSSIGLHSHILSGTIVNNSDIGAYTYISKNALVQNSTIGNYCSISHDVILGLGAHPLNLFSTSTVFYKVHNALKVKLIKEDLDFKEFKPIIIGSDVWIGARVIVMDGIQVGHGAVLAAGAVVTKDVPPYAIVGGIPSKIIKYRFPENVRTSLLETEWWVKTAEEVHLDKEILMNICNNNN